MGLWMFPPSQSAVVYMIGVAFPPGYDRTSSAMATWSLMLTMAIDPARRAAWEAAAKALTERARAAGESGAECRVSESGSADAVSAEGTARMLRGLHALPSGVLAVVPTMPELIQTSNNLSTIESAPGEELEIVAGCMTRSSNMAETEATASSLVALGELSGAAVVVGNAYPGWQPRPASDLLDTSRAVYEELFGSTPLVTAIHAGLECGIIGKQVGSAADPLDMISIGPRIEGAHSPDERVYPASVEKSYRFLAAILDRLSAS